MEPTKKYKSNYKPVIKGYSFQYNGYWVNKMREYVLMGGDVEKIWVKYPKEQNAQLVKDVDFLIKMRENIIKQTLSKINFKNIDEVIYSKG